MSDITEESAALKRETAALRQAMDQLPSKAFIVFWLGVVPVVGITVLLLLF